MLGSRCSTNVWGVEASSGLLQPGKSLNPLPYTPQAVVLTLEESPCLCVRQMDRSRGVCTRAYPQSAVPAPDAGVQCPSGVWLGDPPPPAPYTSYLNSSPFHSHQPQVRTHMRLTLMENLPCDSWSGLSHRACDSEGGQAELPLPGGAGRGHTRARHAHEVGLWAPGRGQTGKVVAEGPTQRPA